MSSRSKRHSGVTQRDDPIAEFRSSKLRDFGTALAFNNNLELVRLYNLPLSLYFKYS
jgi:hypothetical protein